MTTLAKLKEFRYAHRGFYQKPEIPENSLPAFRRAVEHGYGVEFDVHITKDERLVVIHDSDVKRMTGEEGIIEDMTLEEIRALRLGGTDEQIPLFDEVLDVFEGTGLPLIIELKHHGNNHLAVTTAVMKRLDSYTDYFCVESFDPKIVHDVKKLRPEIIRGQLSRNFFNSPKELPWLATYIETNLVLNFWTRPQFVAYMFSERDNRANQKCLTRGMQAVSWTIRSMEDLLTAEAEGSIPIFEGFDPKNE